MLTPYNSIILLAPFSRARWCRHNDETELLFLFQVNSLNAKMQSLMNRLEMYRQQSADQGKKISDYSHKVQELITLNGLKEMKIETLQYESNLLRYAKLS